MRSSWPKFGRRRPRAAENNEVAASGFDQLEPAAKVEMLTNFARETYRRRTEIPETVTSLKTKPELAAAKADFLLKTLHEHMAVSEYEFNALGQQRAKAMQQALLTDTQLDPERVFLVANDKAKNHDGMVRLDCH